jgi:hypothetical protein
MRSSRDSLGSSWTLVDVGSNQLLSRLGKTGKCRDIKW